MHSIKLKVDPKKLPKPCLTITKDRKSVCPDPYQDDAQQDEEIEEVPAQPTRTGFNFSQCRKCRGRIWTYDEEQVLVDGLKEGISEEEVAQRLGRTVDAVKNRKARIRERGRVVEH